MPSRSFYQQTSDGCLERREQEEGTAAPFFQLSTNEAIENGFQIDVDESEGWPKCEASDMGILAAQPMDAISNKILLDDSPLDRGETFFPIPVLDDLHSGILRLTTNDANQDGLRRSYRGHSLSVSEIRELRDIAMPYYALPIADRAEEADSSYSHEPEVEVRIKKRKSSTYSEGAETKNLSESRKRGHNAIEKRYRSNINDKIAALRQKIPSLRVISKGKLRNGIPREAEGHITSTGHNCGKAEILTGAVDYISHLEGTIERIGSEVLVLKARVMAFEKLAMSGSIVLSGRTISRTPTTETLQTVQAEFEKIMRGK